MSNQLEALGTVVQDDSLNIDQRRDAAAHIVRLTVDGVSEVPDTDPEVIELCKPWHGTEATKFLAEIIEQVGGRPVAGWSLPVATAQVLAKHRERAVYALIDESLPRLIRLAAVSHIRSSLSERHPFIKGDVDEAAMLNKVCSPETTRQDWNGKIYAKRPVSRPPVDFSDVWQS